MWHRWDMLLVIFHNVCFAFECLCVTVTDSRSWCSLLCTARAEVYIAVHACCALVLGCSQFGSSVNSFAVSVCMCCGYTLARVLWASWKDYPTSDWTFGVFVFVCSRLHWRTWIRFPKRLCHPRSQQQCSRNHSLLSWPTSSTIRVFSIYIPSPRLHATVMRDCPSSFRSFLPPLM